MVERGVTKARIRQSQYLTDVFDKVILYPTRRLCLTMLPLSVPIDGGSLR